MTATQIAAEVARQLRATSTGRDIHVNTLDTATARTIAHKLGATDTTVRASAIYGETTVTIWEE